MNPTLRASDSLRSKFCNFPVPFLPKRLRFQLCWIAERAPVLSSRKLQSNRLLAAPQNPLKEAETEELSVSPAAAKEISTDVATATVLSATAGIFIIKEARRTTPSRYSVDGGEGFTRS